MAPDFTMPISPRVIEVFYMSPPVDDFYSSNDDVVVIFWNDQQWCDQVGQTGDTIPAGTVTGSTQAEANSNARALLVCAACAFSLPPMAESDAPAFVDFVASGYMDSFFPNLDTFFQLSEDGKVVILCGDFPSPGISKKLTRGVGVSFTSEDVAEFLP
jgi:hypothetical protein